MKETDSHNIMLDNTKYDDCVLKTFDNKVSKLFTNDDCLTQLSIRLLYYIENGNIHYSGDRQGKL